MRIPKMTLQLALCMSLCVPPAFAENFSMPDKAHRQGMSYEEYTNYRAKMRMQMEKAREEEKKQAPLSDSARADEAEKHKQKREYGQGYQSRGRDDARPDIQRDSKPERPRLEKFNRGNMGRR